MSDVSDVSDVRSVVSVVSDASVVSDVSNMSVVCVVPCRENEEGPPMALSVALFQSWSRGTGANLLAADAGMGLMHTGSGTL